MRLDRPALIDQIRSAAALAAVLAAVALALPASAQEVLTYRAKPGTVLACGGVTGDCRVLTIEGSLELAGNQIVGSRLVLRELDGTASPFPAAGDLPLTGAVGDGWIFVSPPGAQQSFRLERMWRHPSPRQSFQLRGTYDEGCCDRFRYEINALFVLVGGGGQQLRLSQDTFRIGVRWTDHQGTTGAGTPSPLGVRSGSFWFFRSDNPELLVKLIDACDLVGHWWFFAAGLTDVAVEIQVEGPGGAARTYERPVGEPFAPILDTAAFPCLEP